MMIIMSMKLIKMFILITGFVFLIPNTLAASTSVTYDFDSSEYYQGGNGGADIWITNTGSDYILVEDIWLHFDWMESGYGYVIDKTSTPIKIDAGSKVYIGKISFSIDSLTSIGDHSYQWKIRGLDNKIDFWGNPYLSSFDTGWFGSNQLYIESSLKPLAEAALINALNDINTARSKNFECPDAINKVNQAVTDYNSGINAKNGRDFSSATNYANSAKKLVQESYPIEQTYQTNKVSAEAALSGALNDINTARSKNFECPDAINKVNQAVTDYNSGLNAKNGHDFSSTINYANSAKKLILESYPIEQTYQSNKASAEAAKNAANVEMNKVLSSQSVDAKNKLTEANSHFKIGETDFTSNDFNSAISEYNIAKSLAQQASNLENEYQAKQEAELKAKQETELENAKQEAESIIKTVKSQVNGIDELKSENAKNMLSDARKHLNTAENHLSSSNFDAAISEANIAGDYADNAVKTDEEWISKNPIRSIVPGFQFVYTIFGIILVYAMFSKR